MSGAAALVYEVLWMRRFAILLGATAPAAAAALAAFFIGLGLGSYFWGRVSPRLPRPLRAFALLELITGVSALGVDPLLGSVQPVLGWLYDAPGDNVALQLAVKVVIAIIAVLIPATAIGGTLPVLAQFVAPSARSLGVRIGGLYAVNTLGACVGALGVPAVLPWLGVSGTFGAAIALNLVAAAGALVVDRRTGPIASGSREPQSSTPVQRRRVSRGTVWLAAASGAMALALEALASRAFSLIHENSVYSFATVIAVFLAGLGGGAAIARRALDRGIAPRTLASFGWAGSGVWIVLLPAMFVHLTGLDYLSGGAHVVQAHLALLAGAVLLVPGVLLGLPLPALIQDAGDEEGEGGPAVGVVVTANTAGAIAGPFIALFGIAPRLGLWNAVSVLGAGAIASAIVAARGGGTTSRRSAFAAAAIAIAAFALTAPGSLPSLKLSTTDTLLELREGAFGTVAVVVHDGHRRITLNNFYVLGGAHAAGDERLQGHIPLLLHSNPRRVAFLGLGTGISFSAIRFHPIRDALALELVPDVTAAARDWFGDSNLGVLTDPRVRVRAEDARSFIGATHERFDVVVGDLVVPWRRGESSLYTRDSFEAVRRVLAPGGLYCQWVPLYQLSEAEFDGLAASFLDVFPQTTLWRGDFQAGQATVALVGHTDPRGLDAAQVDARSRALMASPDRSNPYLAHPAGLWLYFVGPLKAADSHFRSAMRNEDANPWVELASPSLHLQIQQGRARPFIGRPLKQRLDAIRAAPLAGTVAASLGSDHIEWRERGADIWTASLLSFEGDDDAADRVALSAIARLPAEIQMAVLGDSRR